MDHAQAGIDLMQLTADQNSVVVLARTGRLASWHQLTDEQRSQATTEHVELMIAVARKYQMSTLDGYRLIGPQQRFERFWVIEFPDLAGAEAWINAEMRPPYGLYGFYEYDLARRFATGFSAALVTDPLPSAKPNAVDPNQVPPLGIDDENVAGLMFSRLDADAVALDPARRGDEQHLALAQAAAQRHQLRQLEGFQLLGPRSDWHCAWVALFPRLEGVEAWIDAELALPFANHGSKSFLLARRWQPDYFSAWVTDAPEPRSSDR